MNITLLIPTKNRLFFVKRILKYYQTQNFQGYIYILDSSEVSKSKKIFDFIKKLNNDKILYDHDFGFPGMIMKKYISNIKTDYIAELGDDDYLIPSGIKNCIDFLDKNTDFSAVHGESIMVISNNNLNEIDYIDLYDQTIRLENSSKERMLKHLTNYSVPNFSVYRKKVFEKILSAIPNYEDSALCPDRNIVDELIQSTMSVVYTKIKKIQGLYLVRHMTQFNTSIRQKLNSKIRGKKFEKSVNYFINEISNAICEVESLSYKDAKPYVIKAVKDYFSKTEIINKKNNLLKNICLKLFYILKISLKFIGIFKFVKKIFNPYDNLLELHKNTNSPFYSDFMPVYNSIINNIEGDSESC